MLATLFASPGTIMLTAGDEFGRTQLGNNNAYCQDNEITWLDWEGRERDLEDFVATLASERARNTELYSTFQHDALWTSANGNPMTVEDWDRPSTTGFSLKTSRGDWRLALTVDRPARRVEFSLARNA